MNFKDLTDKATEVGFELVEKGLDFLDKVLPVEEPEHYSEVNPQDLWPFNADFTGPIPGDITVPDGDVVWDDPFHKTTWFDIVGEKGPEHFTFDDPVENIRIIDEPFAPGWFEEHFGDAATRSEITDDKKLTVRSFLSEIYGVDVGDTPVDGIEEAFLGAANAIEDAQALDAETLAFLATFPPPHEDYIPALMALLDFWYTAGYHHGQHDLEAGEGDLLA